MIIEKKNISTEAVEYIEVDSSQKFLRCGAFQVKISRIEKKAVTKQGYTYSVVDTAKYEQYSWIFPYPIRVVFPRDLLLENDDMSKFAAYMQPLSLPNEIVDIENNTLYGLDADEESEHVAQYLNELYDEHRTTLEAIEGVVIQEIEDLE